MYGVVKAVAAPGAGRGDALRGSRCPPSCWQVLISNFFPPESAPMGPAGQDVGSAVQPCGSCQKNHPDVRGDGSNGISVILLSCF